MSIRNITIDNKIDLKCGSLITENLITKNDDGSETRINTTNQGTVGQVLTTDGNGNVYWNAGGGGGGNVVKTPHSNLTMYAGTNPATGGVNFITDKDYILLKNGNYRIMSGRVDATLIINGYNFFSLSFSIPDGEIIPTATSIFINGGTASDAGGNSPNFLAIGASVVSGKIIISYLTVDKELWPQSQSVLTTVKYSISYITN